MLTWHSVHAKAAGDTQAPYLWLLFSCTLLLLPSGLTSPQGKFCYVCMSCPPEKNHKLFWASQSKEELHG